MKIKQFILEDEEWNYEEDEEEYISSSEAKMLREWQAIIKAAETNKALKAALDRVKVTYNLIKDHGSKT